MLEIGLSEQLLGCVLRECAEEVLGTMLFSEILGERSGDDLRAHNLLGATLSISGPLSGIFRTVVSEPAATALAADFLGLDETPGPTRVQQVINELANMICGSALSRIEPEALFTLGDPEPASDPFPPNGVFQCFELTEGLLAVSIEFTS